jgi:glycosyltransferase involved in cell wall biosynthesis
MMRVITLSDRADFQRTTVVVCMPVLHGREECLASLARIMRHTEPSIPMLLVGARACLDGLAVELVEKGWDERVTWCVTDSDGEVGAINAAIHASAPADLVLVAAGVYVTDGWLGGLRSAATSDSTVASSTPLSLGPGGVEPFDGTERRRNVGESEAGRLDKAVQPWPLTPDAIDEAAARVAARALHHYPRVVATGPGCTYLRRAALELGGHLDESCAAADAFADWAKRLVALGMVHVLADGVLVRGRSRQSSADEVSGYSISETMANDERGSLRGTMKWTQVVLQKLSVTIDARSLTAVSGGTQSYVTDLILALARRDDVCVRALVPPDLSEHAAEVFGRAQALELLSYDQATKSPRLTDVVHRPQQVFTPEDMGLLRMVGERVVVGHQDLIAYHNYSYHRDLDAWRMYRRITRLALAGADQTIFFSEHAREDALAEGLVPRTRAHVVGIGAERLMPEGVAEVPPEGIESDDPFLLCLGADYAHKNRPFAIELLVALRDLGWEGQLVFAGAHVPYGSSRRREQELLRQNPGLTPAIVDLGSIDDRNRAWLYSHARALVYPTLYEGFGLIPVEAARAGLPCLFAAQASLAELAGDAATLTPWDAKASAVAVLPVLGHGVGRNDHLVRLRALSLPTWDEVAKQLLAVYERAVADPSSVAAPRVWQELDRETYIVRLDVHGSELERTAKYFESAYQSLEARVRFGLPLIDSAGLLSGDEQRGLMRAASRTWLRAVLVKPFGILGRIGKRRGAAGVEGAGVEEKDT